MDRARLEYAAEGFLAEARRQFVKLKPGEDCPIGRLSDYPPDQRSALMAAVARVVQCSSAASDKDYQSWLLQRSFSAQ